LRPPRVPNDANACIQAAWRAKPTPRRLFPTLRGWCIIMPFLEVKKEIPAYILPLVWLEPQNVVLRGAE
jgi:hypothetical protein